jgi:amino acid permease
MDEQTLPAQELDHFDPRPAPITLDPTGNPLPEHLPEPLPEERVLVEPVVLEARPEITSVGRFATLMNLVNSTIGPGIVGIPATFKKSGIGPTVILLLFSCGLCYTCGNILISLQADLRVTGNEALAFALYGRLGKTIVSVISVLFSFTCTVACLIIATSKIVDWLSLSSLPVQGMWGWAVICLIYSVALPCVLTVPRRIAFLSRLGPISSLALVFYDIGISVKSVMAISHDQGIAPSVIGYDFDPGLMSAFAVHALCFALPLVMGPAIAVYNPNIRKRKVILGASYICSWILVSVPALLAYLMKGSDVQSDVLSSFEKDDTLVILLQAGVLVKVTCSYPILCASMMGSLGELFWGQPLAELLTGAQRMILVPCVNIANVVVAMFLKDIQSVLGVGGALGGCLLVFGFPSLCRLKIRKTPLTTLKTIGHLCLIVFGAASALVCTYFTVDSAILSFRKGSQRFQRNVICTSTMREF